jgi:hypothetical protein
MNQHLRSELGDLFDEGFHTPDGDGTDSVLDTDGVVRQPSQPPTVENRGQRVWPGRT